MEDKNESNPSREESINHIMEMGFTREEADNALEHCDNDISRAVQYIFAGADAQAQFVANKALVQQQSNEKGDSSHFENSFADGSMQGFQPIDSYPGMTAQEEQETGFLGEQPQQHFGPAEREFYDQNQWGVVPVENSPRSPEVLNVKTVVPRLRSSNIPALLVPNSDMLYIAPLLVVLHSVPLARKALLNGGTDIIDDYGYDANWWKEASLNLPVDNTIQRAMVETQRLMAFLDGGSKRAYADICNLVAYGALPDSSDSLKGITSTDSPTGRFLEDFIVHFWGRNSEYSQIFELGAKSNDEEEVRLFTNLVADVTVDIEKSLYDIIDELVWPSQNTDETYLHHLGDVVHITLKRDDGNSGVGIDVPSTWYPDRYLKKVTPFIGEIRRRRKEMQNELSNLSKQKFQLSTYMGKDSSKLLQITADFFKQESESDDQLKSAYEDIDSVKTTFESRKSELFQKISDLGDQIAFERDLFKGTNPSGLEKIFPDVDEIPELRPYHFVGAIISPTEYCFKCRDGSDDLIELDRTESWWKVYPHPETGEPHADKVIEEDVLQYAKEGSKDYSWQEVILVYANDNALDSKKHHLELTQALQNFVSIDKKVLIKQIQQKSSSSPDLIAIDSD